jgi:hypothetical protein
MPSVALLQPITVPRTRRRTSAPSLTAAKRGATELADACRSAALGFLTGVAEGWDKKDLAEWLGVYQSIAVRSEDASACLGRRVPPAGRPVRLDAGRIERLLSDTREEAVDVVLALTDPQRGIHFGFYAVIAGLVTNYVDPHGNTAWAPVDLPRMSLLDRLLSLFAVDYLLRPAEYERSLRICRRCDAVHFEAREGGLGRDAACWRCGRDSMVVPAGDVACETEIETRLAG